MSKIRVLMEEHGKGKLFIDDHQVSGLVKIEFSVGVGEANKVILHLLAADVVIESRMEGANQQVVSPQG